MGTGHANARPDWPRHPLLAGAAGALFCFFYRCGSAEPSSAAAAAGRAGRRCIRRLYECAVCPDEGAVGAGWMIRQGGRGGKGDA